MYCWLKAIELHYTRTYMYVGTWLLFIEEQCWFLHKDSSKADWNHLLCMYNVFVHVRVCCISEVVMQYRSRYVYTPSSGIRKFLAHLEK